MGPEWGHVITPAVSTASSSLHKVPIAKQLYSKAFITGNLIASAISSVVAIFKL